MYRVRVLQEARGAIAALPTEALAVFAEARTVLETAPWSGPPQNADNPDCAVRHLLFGPAAAGQIVYLILDHAREVHVLVVLWLGD